MGFYLSSLASNCDDTTLALPIIRHFNSWAWPYLLPRVGLGLLFIYAGATKLLDIHAFGVVMARYGLVPEALLLPAALGLPLLEILAGLGLILELRGSLSLVSALLVIFAAVLWFGVLQGLEIDCGCFAPRELAEHDSLRQALYRDLALMAVAAYLYLWRWRRGQSPKPHGWRWDWNKSNPREEIS
jgi:uncharacterized membrane protein YphA (DoxX/SURF4 family)